MSQPVFLKIYHSGKLMTNKQFVSDQISIGSSADGPSLTLADPSVCFWHALIEKRGGQYHISDLGSPNGTFINAQPILESALKHGDKIQIGDFVIQFFIGVPFVRPQVAGGAQPAVSASQTTKPMVQTAMSQTDKSPLQTAVPPAQPDKHSASPPNLVSPASSPPSVPVSDSADVSDDSKIYAEDSPPKPVSVPVSDQRVAVPSHEEVTTDENPIPLFAHVPKEEDVSSTPSDESDLGPSAQKEKEVQEPTSFTDLDSHSGSHSGFFPKTSDSTAPVLQNIEEVYEEPILHPSSVKKNRELKTDLIPTDVPEKHIGPTAKPVQPVSAEPEVPVSAEPEVPISAEPEVPVSAEPEVPISASVPAQPVIPEVPVQPPVSAGASVPAQPVIPEVPVQPPVSAGASVPAKPVIPEVPVQPPVSAGASVPAQPVIPEVPVQPPVSAGASVPAKPVIPEVPVQPPVSAGASVPAKPVIPEVPVQPPVSAGVSVPAKPVIPEVPRVESAPMVSAEPKAPLVSAKPPQGATALPLKQISKGTYAPESEIKDLSAYLSPGNGPIVEIIVAWKERVLSVHHFEDNKKEITFGSDPKADIFCTNLIGKPLYTLLDIKKNPAIFISKGVQVHVRDHKGQYSFDKLTQQGLITTYGSRQVLPLNQGQLVCLTFSSALEVYIRYANRVQKAVTTGLFNFNFSEMVGIMMSFFFMSMLVFYVALFSPQFLESTEDLEEADIKKATIEFKKKRVVKLKMANTAQKKRTKLSIPNKSKSPKKTKKVGIKKPGKQGRLGQVAAKPKSKSKKKTVTSARSGRSVHTKKAGAGPKSPRPDPTKVGLLGVFGKKGTQKVLDKAYSGTGELAGLADQATGHAGQKDAYTGEGIGTKFKNAGAGGKGSALIGVSSGIKTKGRGGGAKGYGRGGSLGQRGMVQLELGTSDWDVAGGVDKNAILRVIRRNKHQLEWCYEFSLQKRPDMEGKVLLKWDILNERVRSVKVMSNTTRDSALARCLMSRLKNFRFTGTGLQKGQIGEVRIPFAVTKG